MPVQTTYATKPASRAAGMVANAFGPPQYVSRPLSTRQLEEITFGDDGGAELYTVTIDGVEVANYTSTGTNTATQLRDEIYNDLVAAGIVTEQVSTDKLLIEAPGDDAADDFTIALSAVSGTFSKTQLVAHGQEVPFGLGLVRDDRAPSGGPRKCRLPRLATDVTGGLFLGVAAQNVMREPNVNGWPHQSMPNILRVGHIYVVVEAPAAGAGTEGKNLFMRHASGAGGTQLGAFREDADSASAVAVPGLRAMEDWTAAGTVLAEFIPQT